MPVTTRSSSANIVEAAKNLVRLKHSAAVAKPATRTTTSSGRPKRACAAYVRGMYAEDD
jgi:hypothetical protein